MTTINVAVPTYYKSGITKSRHGDLIGVLLPTYCEAENIGSLIREIKKLNLNLMIAVVDDSSPDGTSRIVKCLQKKFSNIHFISRTRKLGLGTAIVTGFKFFLNLNKPPDYIITMDSDYSHNPNDITQLVDIARRGNDLVIGSRYVDGGALENWPLKRRIISRFANVIAAFIIGRRIKDCTSGFRCYSKTYVEKVLPTLHSTTYEIQIETLRQAKLNHFKVKETPITFTDRKKGKSKLSKDEVRGFLTYIGKSWLANLLFPRKS
ncbi:MAG: polyprenol monophosphomannose synthase [Chloroflexota bacterium]